MNIFWGVIFVRGSNFEDKEIAAIIIIFLILFLRRYSPVEEYRISYSTDQFYLSSIVYLVLN